MKKFLTLLITICLLSGITQAQFNADKDPFIIRALAGNSIQKVFARTSGGSISVAGSDSGETRLEVYVNTNAGRNSLSKEELQKRLEKDYDLNISISNDQLTVTARQKDKKMDWKRQLSISFKVFVSRNISTDLSTSGGSIRLDNLTGRQDFSTSGGSLSLDKLNGNIYGRTSGGSVSIANSGKDINLKTSGGSIKAENCNGTIKLSTSGGPLNLDNLEGNIEANTSGGSIHGNNIKGELITHTSGGGIGLRNLAGSVDASTSGGGIDVEVTELGKYITLANSGGNINLKMPAGQGLDLKLRGQKIAVNALNNFSGSKDDDEISGTLNGGGIPVSVRTGSGRINLALK